MVRQSSIWDLVRGDAFLTCGDGVAMTWEATEALEEQNSEGHIVRRDRKHHMAVHMVVGMAVGMPDTGRSPRTRRPDEAGPGGVGDSDGS